MEIRMIKEIDNETKQKVELLCGEYPADFIDIEIESNPNFVFKNDLNYNAVQLFDLEENSVFVNSFLECQHYVRGGWDYIPNLRNESFYHNTLLAVSLTAILVGLVIVKLNLKKNAYKK